MARSTAVLLVAGLSPNLLGDQTPRLRQFARQMGGVRTLVPDVPAVTCTVQSSMLTGLPPGGPGGHGIVANGWYDRESAEVRFWKQSNRLVHGERVWDAARARDASVTTANLFWWFDMYSSAEFAVTPRPMYPADGRKVPDIWTHPPELRESLQRRFGRFPLFHFWGPRADIRSTEWIVGATVQVTTHHRPGLTLVYLPHLDYVLQRDGPGSLAAARELREIDRQVGILLDHFAQTATRVMIVSEYGIEPVSKAIELNRILRHAGTLQLREELGREHLDAGASDAFAVVDHQVAHVYLRDPGDAALHQRVAELLRRTDGVDEVLDREAQRERLLDHPRSGDFLCIAAPGAWFAYGWWEDPAKAPDYARTVDIHRKPGYDPCELFIDPKLTLPGLRVAWTLAKRRLGLRSLLEVIPLDPSLVRGSHGRDRVAPGFEPLLIADNRFGPQEARIGCREVKSVILEHLFA
ncbi:MAG: alkaline phosphatase family protein [Phycisphaeraceae bacterium]|nr:alkaline phosphatase family protein [Phycisphaeraceae bacterium]